MANPVQSPLATIHAALDRQNQWQTVVAHWTGPPGAEGEPGEDPARVLPGQMATKGKGELRLVDAEIGGLGLCAGGISHT